MLSKSREKMNMEMWFVLALWFQLLTLSFEQQPKYQEVQQKVYVSRGRGRDFPSCGSPSNPCKTIVMGAWKVQHNGQVFVDGTGSEEHPYPCKSSSLESSGIHSNKSMVITGVQEIPHVKCQEGYDIRLGQSLLDHNMTTVQLTNLKFVNTSVNAQDINLYIDDCVFTGASRAVNLVQSTTTVNLSFKNSLCVNVSSCIGMSINQRITPINRVSIYVAHSRIVTSWLTSHPILPDQFPGIQVTSTGEYMPGLITCDVGLKNVTFKDNVLDTNGLIYVNLMGGNTSLRLEDVVFLDSRFEDHFVANIISIYSNNHYMILNNTRFLQNYHVSCRAIGVGSDNNSSLYIVNSQFEKFQPGHQLGLFFLISKYSEVFMENNTFTNNLAEQNMGGILNLDSGIRARVIIKDSTFRNNFGGCGGILWLSATSLLILKIQGCYFDSNNANEPGGLAAIGGKNVNIEVTDSTLINFSSRGPGGIFDIGFTDCWSKKSIENVNVFLKNVQVLGCSGEGSGGMMVIRASNYGSITVQDSRIEGTQGTGEGGVFAFYTNVGPLTNNQDAYDIKLMNSTFKNSRSGGPGGVLYAERVRTLTLDSVVIDSGESAGAPGAGLYIVGLSITTVNINNSVIKNCPNAMYFLKLSVLKIINSIFESNTALNGQGSCLYLLTGHSVTLFRNVTFKDCISLSIPGGAIFMNHGGGHITIDSCMFQGNKAPRQAGGAMAIDLTDKDEIVSPGCINNESSCFTQDKVPHRTWSYNTSVFIKNTIFIDNKAATGGALFLSRGNFTLENCSFIDNLAKLRAGHIYVTSDSTSLTILHSSFLQSSMPEIDSTFSVGSFIDSESVGPLIILNSKLQSNSFQRGRETLVTVSKANYLDFDESNQTVLTCPRGSKLDIVNMTTEITTEYKSSECIILMNVMQFTCSPCEIGTYSLQHGQSLGTNIVSGFHCFTCPFGAECLNRITAKHNFWGYKIQENPTKLNFTLCPVGYCKQPSKQDFSNYNSCYGNRTGPLCGVCKANYTETLLSPTCRRQGECHDTWLWGVAVVMVLLMALFFIHKPPLLRMLKSHVLWFRRPVQQDQSNDAHGSGYLKIIFYFYQVANILLISSSYNTIVERYLLQPVVGLFNFEFRLSSRGLLCPFVGLTVVTKQLLFVCPVFGVLLMIAVCYGCHCLLHKCTSKAPPTLGPYVGAALETLLLGYAVLASTSLKLLRCITLDQDTRLFIAADVPCFQGWQYGLMVIIAFVAFPLIVILALGSRWLYKDSISVKEFCLSCAIPLPYLVYKLASFLCGSREPTIRPEPPQWKISVTNVLYGPFREPQDNSQGAIYWESVLVFRRLVLIIIYVFVADPLSKQLILTLICVIILSHHILVHPFRSQSANIAELISLFSLVAIATINTFKASFLSLGQSPQGQLQSMGLVLDWTQVVILTAVPVLFLIILVVTIVSQCLRLVIKISSFVTCSCIVRSDDVRSLLDASTFDDSDVRS